MSRNFNGNAANYLRLASTPITAPPLTISCWVNSSVASGVPICVLYSGNNVWNGFYLSIGAGPVYQCSTAANNVFGTSNSASSTLNVWHHVVGVFASAASRTVYLDGKAGATDTTNLTPSPVPDNIGIGISSQSVQGNPVTGDIAHAAVWSAALTAYEVAQLAKNVDPRTIRFQSLAVYLPLGNQNEVNQTKPALSFTNVGTTQVKLTPPGLILTEAYPFRRRVADFSPPAGGGATVSSPALMMMGCG